MPGLVDAHNHAPQYSYAGTAYDLSIQERLRELKIPNEAKFADIQMARKIYPKAVVRDIECGPVYTISDTPLVVYIH